MPVYALSDDLIFPDPNLADNDGLLAIGGDLSAKRLLLAYQHGIFPWYSEGQPILWWSPNPRMVLFPDQFRRHKNLRRKVKSNKFKVKFDSNFEQVIDRCSHVPRHNQDGTWITGEMKLAYIRLHHLGYCHSVEVYSNEKLVGGLYGVSIGKAFFGESMFHLESDASKVALWYLVEIMIEWGFEFIDVQQDTEHLRSLGAQTIDRAKFLTLLEISVHQPGHIGNWSNLK